MPLADFGLRREKEQRDFFVVRCRPGGRVITPLLIGSIPDCCILHVFVQVSEPLNNSWSCGSVKYESVWLLIPKCLFCQRLMNVCVKWWVQTCNVKCLEWSIMTRKELHSKHVISLPVMSGLTCHWDCWKMKKLWFDFFLNRTDSHTFNTLSTATWKDYCEGIAWA